MNVPEPLTPERLAAMGVPPDEAAALLRGLDAAKGLPDAPSRWAFLTREVLRPRHPGPVHRAFYAEIGRGHDPSLGPLPAWFPPDDATSTTNLGRLVTRLGFASEDEFRSWSVREPGAFWGAMAGALGVVFDRPYTTPLNLADGPERPRWFDGSSLNITQSCFLADPGATALVEHSERGGRRTLTYGELQRQVDRFAAGLKRAGLAPGDAVALLLPLTVEAVVALLGIVRAGCVAVGVPESFAPPEVALRLAIGRAKWAVTQDAVNRRGAVLPLYPKLEGRGVRCVVVGTEGPLSLRDGDVSWDGFLADVDTFEPVACDPSSAMVVLFSSGTTGDPKAIPWTQTTPIKAAADGFLYHDLRPGDVAAWPSSPGWMMGPWLVFATLMNRATVALYDGHPGTEGFCRFVGDAGVTVLGLVPSLVAAWRAAGWPGCDWQHIKTFSSTGECSSPGDMLDLMARAGYRPVVEYCGGTEVGGGYVTSSLLKPNAPSCFNTVAYGLDLTVRDETGRPADRGEGFLVGPSVGLSTELLNRDHHATYFEGTPETDGPWPLRRHGDQIERVGGGFYRVLGRVDDTMNLGGIKVSAVEIERVFNRHPRVRESAAVTAHDGPGGPDRLVAYVVPDGDPGSIDTGALRRELQGLVSAQLNPLFRVAEVVAVGSLPRTASNKMMRRLLRNPAGQNECH